MLQFWSVSYKSQVCKIYFYFEQVRNFGQQLCLSVLVYNESILLLAFVIAFVKYMLYNHCTENYLFSYFLEAKNLVL